MGQQIDGMSHLLDGIPGEPWQQAVQSVPLSRAPRMSRACRHPEHGKEPCPECERLMQIQGDLFLEERKAGR